MIGLWSYTNFRLRNKECEVLLGGIVFYFKIIFNLYYYYYCLLTIVILHISNICRNI